MDIDRALYLIFAIPCGLVELYISLKKYSSTQPKSSSKDSGTLAFIWIIITCSQVLTVHCIRQDYGAKILDNGSFKYFLWIPANICVYFLGHLLRQQAIQQLGTWFTTAVRTNRHQQLINSGWYAKMRHPSYTGVLMYFLAVTLLLNNWLGLVGILMPVVLVFLYRIHVEERALQEHFGQKYEDYRKKVPNMLLPTLF